MSTLIKYYSLLSCQVSEEMREWYFVEAFRRSSKFKRTPASDVMREALQFYIKHVDGEQAKEHDR